MQTGADAQAGKTVRSVVLPDGEQHKTIESVMQVVTVALEHKLNRKATFVALGGGVTGDICGFAASIYQRGVPFIQVPTSLMAMVDSSVGGKTGVNHEKGKNMIGTFYQPKCVVMDLDVLETLPPREYISGLAEVIKYGIICDKEFFTWLEGNMEKLLERDREAVAHAVKRSCEIKADIVAQDELDTGMRATLNLGHTFGHALEAASGYGTLLHGEAVSIGICMAAELSQQAGFLPQDASQRIVALLRAAHLPISLARFQLQLIVDNLLDLMASDKKNAGGRIQLVLMNDDLGSCIVTEDYPHAELRDVLVRYTSQSLS